MHRPLFFNCLKELQDLAEDCHTCWSKEELDDVIDRSQKPKVAIQELITITKGAITKADNAIKKGLKDLDDAKTRDHDQKKRTKKGHDGKGKKSGVVLHDDGIPFAQQLKPLALSGWKSHANLDIPALVALGADHAILKPTAVLRNAVDGFKAKFEAAKRARLNSGNPSGIKIDRGIYRAQRAVGSQQEQAAREFFHNNLPLAGDMGMSVPQALLENIFPCTYGIESDYSFATNEKDHLAAFRVSYSGTRSVVLARTEALSKFIRGTKEAGADPDKIKTIATRFHKFTLDEVRSFAKGAVLYAATIGCADILYVPAGYTVSEVVSTAQDNLGLKQSVVMASDVATFTSLSAELLLYSGKAQSSLQTLVAHLKSLPGPHVGGMAQECRTLASAQAQTKGSDHGTVSAGLAETAASSAVERDDKKEDDVMQEEQGEKAANVTATDIAAAATGSPREELQSEQREQAVAAAKASDSGRNISAAEVAAAVATLEDRELAEVSAAAPDDTSAQDSGEAGEDQPSNAELDSAMKDEEQHAQEVEPHASLDDADPESPAGKKGAKSKACPAPPKAAAKMQARVF